MQGVLHSHRVMSIHQITWNDNSIQHSDPENTITIGVE